MLRVYHSNRLDVLEALMEFIVERERLDDPFEPEMILVQSTGMAQWLQMALSQKFGIAANIEFPLPASFIWDMFVRVLPEIPKESAFNKQSMTWKLMTLLPQWLDREDFTLLRHYLTDDSDKRKLFQLSARAADLFDQYLVYRPEWLSQWEAGKLVDGLSEAQVWQAPLWKALVEYTAELGQPRWHRANLYQRFIETLESATTCPPGLPSRVFICGISALPPVYLQALQALGKHIEIHLLFTNPCRYYWGDIKDPAYLAKLLTRQRRHSFEDRELPLFRKGVDAEKLFNSEGEQDVGNPLLASWGKLGRDYIYLLSDLDNSQELDAFVDITPDNLLHNIQSDILELENRAVAGVNIEEFSRSDKKRLLDPQDNSVTFHVCHSPQREVEVLHDRLLAMLEEDPTLTPRDIIVMVADIDSYSPFIQAVFGSAPADRYLPYAISDRRARQSHPVLEAFITLLSLPDSRFVSEDVLALLDVPVLAARFDITEEGLRYLRQWVNESGIRWGIDDDNVRELELPATGQHTWRFGLTRMLLGYAMESAQGEWQSVLPYDESSGLIAELVGHLASLLMQLNIWRRGLAQERPLEEWLPVCRDMLNAFFLPDAETEAAMTLIEQQWQAVIAQGLGAQYNEAVPLSLLRDELAQRLDQERISQRFLAGPVNICTLMPMRSIPFKVVCLLGMNDGVYPRQLAPLGFDLMSQKPRRGDRSRRDDDRYLFLEALISAQQKLYISYIGRSIQDNSERFPSVLVQELIDYIGQSHYLPGDEALNCDESEAKVKAHITCMHTRMPFDPQNYLPGEQQSYAREWLPAASQSGEAHSDFVQPLPFEMPSTLLLESLQRFWAHPVRAFFQMRLRVNFRAQESEIPDTEPFTLEGLTRYQINQQLLNTLVEQEDSERLFRRFRAAGELPYGAFGEILWETQCQEMQQLADRVIACRLPGQSMEVDLNCNGVQLTGWLPQVQDDGLLRWRPSLLSVSQGVQLWLEHLVYCACGGTGESRLFLRKDGEWRFPPLETEQALHYLVQLIEGYREGMSSPLLVLPESGGAWIKTCYDTENDVILTDEDTQQKARTKFLQAYEGNMIVRGEGDDIWYQRLWRQLEPETLETIVSQSQRFLLPIFRFNQS
ncbi:exodeoxyribonuclease V subunit gamma [Escherichia fergusonii]|uniref:exodeoxyribonuclease V subunit gamma n=1 Tax=Escherichia fergusonii TaxID=564 RepID=UPI001CC00A8B|nr:exodeoxyribonuclease V subunit gamma [Escherichia fergusonii]MBZ4077716.1 exodeoxyribonuclease V subunit gamma [Escherichia fergusonii]MBZ4108472.1 exodeoxyribonuclease V subunit gamma [Escherichia fergusonii]MBZ4113357.1 exodeoxyribonuclease V subunit gamma [Escherichia fergusonii]MBZ4120229.1 exodeoxyribonuclease V subunit gamma [Escherichia fergusonii]MBZ4125443.1 exodeoxyribonuclease V subunit gamma [Escherichia fergusonii]